MKFLVALVAFFRPLLLFGYNKMGIKEAAERYTGSIEKIPEQAEYCLVLGALVKSEVTPLLKERLDVAIAVYRKKSQLKFILSGCGSNINDKSDVEIMYEYLLNNSEIPPANLLKDFEGYTTLHSFKSLRHKKITKEPIVITNKFHLPRALYIAEQLGFIPYGIAGEPPEGSNLDFFVDREIAASYKAWFNLHI